MNKIDSKIPQFIVIGAQKSASTFVQACLSEHPDLYMPETETPYFESPDYENAAIPPWDELFAKHNHLICGIKRPNYLGRPEVPWRIIKDLPDIKLIAVVRNPVDRLVAAYFHLINYGFLPAIALEKGLDEIISGGPLCQNFPISSELIEFGFYAKYLKMYAHFQNSGRLLCLVHDDILLDPLNEIEKCYSFLGVDPSFSPKALKSRPQRVIYSIPRLRFLNVRNRILYDYNKNKTRLKLRKLNFAEWLFVASITAVDRYGLGLRPAQKPKLSAELSRKCRKIYEDDIKELELLIGRDLSAWR